MPIRAGVLAHVGSMSAPPALPAFALVGAMHQYSSASSSHTAFSFSRSIPVACEYLVIPIAVTINAVGTGLTITGVTVGASPATVLLQPLVGTHNSVVAMAGIASPPSGEQVIAVTFGQANARRSAAGAIQVEDFGSLGASNRAVSDAGADEASVVLATTSSPSMILAVAQQRSDESDAPAPLSGCSIIGSIEMAGTLGMNMAIVQAGSPADGPHVVGAAFSIANRQTACSAIEVAA